MNSNQTNEGGWRDSEMRTYVNGTIYNALPSDLQSVIADTTVVSGRGYNDSYNFSTTDKLYLLSTHEVWSDDFGNDEAYSTTRQLDYYSALGVTTSNSSGAIKQYNGRNSDWWLRSARSYYASFLYVRGGGSWGDYSAARTIGVSAAFRIE